ncbi:MAG TPA: amidohydrolase family protein [Woeseiaceae bacterium]|nr:amidohydrolase family protein [Woeseiaceae bacterium]
MHLRRLAIAAVVALFFTAADAQQTVTRGTDLSVDAASDGRYAIDLSGELWVVPGGGGDARQLTRNVRSVQSPRWSPDRQHIVYQATTDNRQGLWIYDLKSSTTRTISSTSSFDSHPTWHPSGQRITYASDVDGSGLDLWEVDVPTGVRWRITRLPGNETAPAWSANGRDLAYVHHDGERWSLILRRFAEADEVLLTSHDKLAAPSFRPDGSLIVFFRHGAAGVTLDMAILSQPRLIREYAANEQFKAAPVSWLDRQRMVYSANGQIRQRDFDDWRSRAVPFLASIQPEVETPVVRVRPRFPWPDEPTGSIVIRASRLFDGVRSGYRHDLDLLIGGGRIVAIEPRSERHGAILIDLGDLTIIPGLIDADARLPGQLSPGHGPDLLATGITTIVANHPELDRLDELWAGKDMPGPRMLASAQWSIGNRSRPELDPTSAVVTSRSTGLSTGQALATQFNAMELAGLTPEQTLRAVGVNAVAAMRADPYIGRIAVGSAADLVFVDGDPLSDTRAALNVVAVVRNGRFYSVSGLFDRAKRAESVE